MKSGAVSYLIGAQYLQTVNISSEFGGLVQFMHAVCQSWL